MSWREVARSSGLTEVLIDGINIWKHEWRAIEEQVYIAHAEYGCSRLHVWELQHPDRPIRFATGEIGSGIWSFYLERPDLEHPG